MYPLPLDAHGKLLSFAFPGGYPLFYLDGENSTLCPECANNALHDEVEDFRPVAVAMNCEDLALFCDQCSKLIEAAY